MFSDKKTERIKRFKHASALQYWIYRFTTDCFLGHEKMTLKFIRKGIVPRLEKEETEGSLG